MLVPGKCDPGSLHVRSVLYHAPNCVIGDSTGYVSSRWILDSITELKGSFEKQTMSTFLKVPQRGRKLKVAFKKLNYILKWFKFPTELSSWRSTVLQ